MDVIDRVRAFNRAYTQHIGVLDRTFQGTDFTLTELRALHEIEVAAPDGTTARAIATALGLDEGHVSRIVTKWDKRGWLRRDADAADARRRILRLTEVGAAGFGDLHQMARAQVAASIAHLDTAGEAQLVAALETIRTTLLEKTPPPVGDVTLRGLRPGDGAWIISEHARYYVDGLGYAPLFEAVVARIVADLLAAHTQAHTRSATETDHQPRGRTWIAESTDGRRLGSIACVEEDATTARLRILYVHPDGRGLGLGRRLVETCMAFARARGYRRMVLTTHGHLTAALRIYTDVGFHLVEEVEDGALCRGVAEQTWAVDLSAAQARGADLVRA